MIQKIKNGFKNFSESIVVGMFVISTLGSVPALANNSQNLRIVNNESSYFDGSVKKYYLTQKVLKELKELDNICNMLKNNGAYRSKSELLETGEVKANTIRLVEQLRNYLGGWKPYSDTYFDNNGKTAGVIKLVSDYQSNIHPELNVPVKVQHQINDSLNSLPLLNLKNEVKYSLNHLGSSSSFYKIINDINLLLSQTISDLDELKIPEMETYNSKLEDRFERDYRIYIHGSLIKTLKAFEKLLSENQQKVYNSMKPQNSNIPSIH